MTGFRFLCDAAFRGATQPCFDRLNGLIEALGLLQVLDYLMQQADRPCFAEGDEDPWHTLYDRVFSKNPDDLGPRLRAALVKGGLAFPQYYDPDGSYKDDVQAWAQAVQGTIPAFFAEVFE